MGHLDIKWSKGVVRIVHGYVNVAAFGQDPPRKRGEKSGEKNDNRW